MGYRRSPERLAAQRAWQRFVERNGVVIASAGLPPFVTASVDAWDEFLRHGHVAAEPGGRTVDRLSPAEYASLVQLAASYFGAGYEFYVPGALRPEDQAMLSARFASGR